MYLFPEITTNRLFLRNFKPGDKDAIFNLYSNPILTAYMMNPITTSEQAKEILHDYSDCFSSGKGIVWAIATLQQPFVIGTCGFETIDHYDKRAEIGFDLSPDYWGQGLMKEALSAVIEHGFTEMGLNRIQAYVHIENDRSVKLLKSYGFVVEGVLRNYRWFKGNFTDWVLLSFLRTDRHCTDILWN